MRNLIVVGLASALTFSTACTSLSTGQRAQLMEIQNCGIGPEDQGAKNAAVAGALNLLPGVGNFYLATGGSGSDQWAIGGINLLLWPYSVLWGIPEAAIDAGNVNQKQTLDYYSYTRFGQQELERKCGQMGYPNPLKR